MLSSSNTAFILPLPPFHQLVFFILFEHYVRKAAMQSVRRPSNEYSTVPAEVPLSKAPDPSLLQVLQSAD